MLFDTEKLLNTRIQIGIVLAVFFGYWINKFIFRNETSGKWKSPFAKDLRTPLTPLVTDDAKRDETMKRAFTKKLANDTKWDAIVVGSGIGGLSAAALLSKAGMKVLVLEKHSRCGGACHTFKDEGYEFDIGIQYVGNFIRPTLTRTLLEQISDGQIQFAKPDNGIERLVLDAMSPSQREYIIASGPDAFENQLTEQFPDEVQGIKEFFRLLKKAYQPQAVIAWFAVKLLPLWLVNALRSLGLPRLLSDFYALETLSVKDALESLIKNKDLQFMLSYTSVGTWRLPPSRVSLSMMALLHAHCYEYGSCYPIGGASEIPYRILPVIERSGGRVLMKANVSQILIKGGKVIGVRVGNKENSMVDIHAPIVISDAGIHNTLIDLLPESVAEKSPAWPLTKTTKPAIGNLSVFVGLHGTPEELDITAQNIWIHSGTDLEVLIDQDSPTPPKDLLEKPYPFLFLSSSSAKDPSWKNRYPGRSTLSVIADASHSWFAQWSNLPSKKRGDDYDALKNAIGQHIIDQVTTLFPKLKNAIGYFNVGTPITIEHYLSTREGGTYSMEHDIDRFGPERAALLRPESGIKGLYFSGQDVTSCGFGPCLYSGFLCASVVLKKKYVLPWELLCLHKKLYGLPQNKNDLFF